MVSYGFPNSETGYFKIIINLDFHKKSILINVIDNGIPFNLISKSDPDASMSLDERKNGGWGIFLVKRFVNELSYQRKNDENILCLKFNNINLLAAN
ncbi:MAG TPA: ATP-binding protein [Victivallales bacterium]|nr:ATP-binding protein [Victivallales bacterium]